MEYLSVFSPNVGQCGPENLQIRALSTQCNDSYTNVFSKVGLSPSKNFFVICLTESPLKMMKNAFYFILTALLVLRILKIFSSLFCYVGKTAWLEG